MQHDAFLIPEVYTNLPTTTFAMKLSPAICLSHNRHRSGAAMVEFAVVLPVLVLILLGTIETCTMIFLRQSLLIAAYEGARVSIVPESKESDVRNAATHLLNLRRIKNATIKVSPSDIEKAPYGSFIRVEVTAPCSQNSVLPLQFYGGRSLKGTVEMMKEFD